MDESEDKRKLIEVKPLNEETLKELKRQIILGVLIPCSTKLLDLFPRLNDDVRAFFENYRLDNDKTKMWYIPLQGAFVFTVDEDSLKLEIFYKEHMRDLKSKLERLNISNDSIYS